MTTRETASTPGLRMPGREDVAALVSEARDRMVRPVEPAMTAIETPPPGLRHEVRPRDADRIDALRGRLRSSGGAIVGGETSALAAGMEHYELEEAVEERGRGFDWRRFIPRRRRGDVSGGGDGGGRRPPDGGAPSTPEAGGREPLPTPSEDRWGEMRVNRDGSSVFFVRETQRRPNPPETPLLTIDRREQLNNVEFWDKFLWSEVSGLMNRRDRYDSRETLATKLSAITIREENNYKLTNPFDQMPDVVARSPRPYWEDGRLVEKTFKEIWTLRLKGIQQLHNRNYYMYYPGTMQQQVTENSIPEIENEAYEALFNADGIGEGRNHKIGDMVDAAVVEFWGMLASGKPVSMVYVDGDGGQRREVVHNTLGMPTSNEQLRKMTGQMTDWIQSKFQATPQEAALAARLSERMARVTGVIDEGDGKNTAMYDQPVKAYLRDRRRQLGHLVYAGEQGTQTTLFARAMHLQDFFEDRYIQNKPHELGYLDFRNFYKEAVPPKLLVNFWKHNVIQDWRDDGDGRLGTMQRFLHTGVKGKELPWLSLRQSDNKVFANIDQDYFKFQTTSQAVVSFYRYGGEIKGAIDKIPDFKGQLSKLFGNPTLVAEILGEEPIDVQLQRNPEALGVIGARGREYVHDMMGWMYQVLKGEALEYGQRLRQPLFEEVKLLISRMREVDEMGIVDATLQDLETQISNWLQGGAGVVDLRR